MPYNNTAIPPPEEITGSAALPLKSERKPRRNIQYKDVGAFPYICCGIYSSSQGKANAVARIENLEFLADVVPKTVTYREYKQQKAGRTARKQEMLQSGQTTLDNSNAQQRRPNGITDAGNGPHIDQGHPMEVTTNGHSQRGTQLSPPQTNGNSKLVFQHYQPNGDTHQGESQDIEMR
ncbi:MAG: hypothetical protein Q9191_003105 [Dirinaria sp. TL-2023a]